MTANALKYFGYGVPAFALIKVLAIFSLQEITLNLHFYLSALVVLLKYLISLTFFKEIGFIIIPISTSISTWLGVAIYFLLNKNKFINLKSILLKIF